MHLVGDAWNACFDEMRHEAWRLETHPIYTMPQEAETMARFRSGERLPDDYTSPWMDEIRQWHKTGKSVGRVHILTRPLTEYLRFEFDYYRHHIRAGEDIRILDLTDRENPGLPEQDYWMFDRSKVILMNYRPDGTQISRELYEGDPEPYRNWQRIAVAESVPFEEYVKGLGIRA